MTAIAADAARLPARSTRRNTPLAIVGYMLIVAAGLFVGAIAGALLALSTGLIALC